MEHMPPKDQEKEHIDKNGIKSKPNMELWIQEKVYLQTSASDPNKSFGCSIC